MARPSVIAGSQDAEQDIAAGTLTTALASYTAGSGSDRLQCFLTCTEEGSSTQKPVTALEFNGVAATLSAQTGGSGGGLATTQRLWTMKEADIPSGANAVTLTHTAVRAGIVAFTLASVDQAAPLTQTKANPLTGTHDTNSATFDSATAADSLMLCDFFQSNVSTSITPDGTTVANIAYSSYSPTLNGTQFTLWASRKNGDGTAQSSTWTFGSAIQHSSLILAEIAGAAGGGGGSSSRPSALLMGL